MLSKAAACFGALRLSASGLAPFSSSAAALMPNRGRVEPKAAGLVFGKKLAPDEVEAAFREEHKHVEGGMVVNLESEHDRVEDPEVPMLSNLFESHQVPGEALSAEEAAAEVERLKRTIPRVD